MEVVAEGLWGLADHHENQGEIGKAIKCLEAVCQSQVPFLPIIEVKTRLRVATLLLKHTHNVNQAKAHLERAVCNSFFLAYSIFCSFFARSVVLDSDFRSLQVASHSGFCLFGAGNAIYGFREPMS